MLELMSSTYQLLNAKFSRVASCTDDSIHPCKQPNGNDMNDPFDPDEESDGTGEFPFSDNAFKPAPDLMHSLSGATCTTSDMDSFSKSLSCPPWGKGR